MEFDRSLCDLSIRTKGKIYKPVVRPALTYIVECWAIKKSETPKMYVTEIKMLLSVAEVIREDMNILKNLLK